MRKLVLGLLGASALAMSSAASAVVVLNVTPPGPNPPGTFFTTSPSPVLPTYTGPITAGIGHVGIAAGSFMDNFLFTIGTTGGVIGTGSGSVTTSVDVLGFLGTNDVDFSSITFNNGTTTFNVPIVLTDLLGNVCTVPGGPNDCGAGESGSLSNVPITAGALNTLSVSGISRGNGTFTGTLSFNPTTAVPEPATWAMMLLGFAGIGWQLRRKRIGVRLPQFA